MKWSAMLGVSELVKMYFLISGKFSYKIVFYKPWCSTISFPFYTTKLVICFQLTMQWLCAYQLECHGYTTLCFLSNLSGVPGIRQQIPMPLESSAVKQSEFREVVWQYCWFTSMFEKCCPFGSIFCYICYPTLPKENVPHETMVLLRSLTCISRN